MTTELEFPFGSPTEGERKEYRSFIYRTVGWSETEKITCCLEEGARVEARFDGRDTWVGGVIETVRSNGASFDIVYEDGESEQRVPHQRVRPVETTTTEFTTIAPMSAKKSWKLVSQQHRTAVAALSNDFITRWNNQLYSTFRMTGPATVGIEKHRFTPTTPEETRIALRTNDRAACRIMFKLQKFFDLKRRLREQCGEKI